MYENTIWRMGEGREGGGNIRGCQLFPTAEASKHRNSDAGITAAKYVCVKRQPLLPRSQKKKKM